MGFWVGRVGGFHRQTAAGGVPGSSDCQRVFWRAQGQAANLIVRQSDSSV
jgi:hypothetical protein